MRNTFRPTKDTYFSTRSAIASRVLASPLAPYIGYPGRTTEENHAVLVWLRDDRTDRRSFVTVEFRRGDSNCSITIDGDLLGDPDDARRDDAGNDYRPVFFKFACSWPSHGSSDPGTCLARLHLYQQAAMLAAELAAEFSSDQCWLLVRTPEQRAQQEAEAHAKKVKELVVHTIDAVRGGMRVGSFKTLPLDEIKDIPEGRYEHQFNDNKTFTMVIEGEAPARAGMVTRTT